MRDDTNVDWIHGLPFHSFDPSAYGRSVALVAFTYSTPWLSTRPPNTTALQMNGKSEWNQGEAREQRFDSIGRTTHSLTYSLY